MTKEERLKLFDDAATASGTDYAIGVTNVESVLRSILPFIPISNSSRAKRQRAYFIWNGSHIVCGKALDLPPPTDAEVREAIVGLLEDIRSVIENL